MVGKGIYERLQSHSTETQWNGCMNIEYRAVLVGNCKGNKSVKCLIIIMCQKLLCQIIFCKGCRSLQRDVPVLLIINIVLWVDTVHNLNLFLLE